MKHLILIIALVINNANAQTDFRDTVGVIVMDSLNSNIGLLKDVGRSFKVKKQFKYIGEEVAVITRTWTGDPHYICEYPKEPLKKNQVYSITICFVGRVGRFIKTMGFDLSNGERVNLNFKGEVLSLKSN